MIRPLRCAQVIVADPASVRRALARADVWTRTFRALGYRTVSGSTEPRPLERLQEWTFVTDRRRPGRRDGRLTVLAVDDGLPVARVSLGGGPLAVVLDIRLLVAPTGAGVLTTVDGRWAGPEQLAPLARSRALAFGSTLLGIATVTARDPEVIVAGAVLRDGQLLAARRARPVALAGRWEMPGGRVEPGESEREALARELAEELGLTVSVGGRIGPAVDLGEGRELRGYVVRWLAGDPEPLEADPAHDDVRWLQPGQLDDLDWLPSDGSFVAAVREYLHSAEHATVC